MSRLVIDTNCLIQCISRRSAYHDLWLSLLDGRNSLCVSTEILDEYAEIIEKYTSPVFAESALGVITNNPFTLFINPYFNFKLISADPDDNKFIDCAIAANAKYVVTEDSHFEILTKVNLISLDDIIKCI